LGNIATPTRVEVLATCGAIN